MNKITFVKLTEEKADRARKEEIMMKEIELNVRIREEKEAENERLYKEIKEVKGMLRVPRLHYKELEKTDFEGLKALYNQYLAKEKVH